MGNMVTAIDSNTVIGVLGFLIGWLGYSLFTTTRKLKKWESNYDFTNHNYLGKIIVLQGEEWRVMDFTMRGNKVILKNVKKGDYLYVDRTFSKPTL